MQHASVNLSRGGRDVSKLLMNNLVQKKINLRKYTLDPIEIVDSIKVKYIFLIRNFVFKYF